MQNARLKSIIFILGIFLVLSLGGNIWLAQKNKPNSFTKMVRSFSAEPVSPQEIYPLFQCPCCGKTLDQCVCPMASERKSYIEGLTSRDISKDEAVTAYIKKYGLDSFKDKEQKEIFKEKLIKNAPPLRPIISVIPESYDFGDVSQKAGRVYTYFTIKNEGKKDLIIKRLETSCACTSASVVYQGKEGPLFSMSGQSRDALPDWQVVIPPRGKAQLKVYYDPNVHKDFRGPAVREISIFSNDPVNFGVRVKIELNQID